MPTTFTCNGASRSQGAGSHRVLADEAKSFVKRFAPRGRDPAVADENLYRYCGDDPIEATDPSGEAGTETAGLSVDPPVYKGNGTADPWAATIKLPKSYRWGMVIQKVSLNLPVQH